MKRFRLWLLATTTLIFVLLAGWILTLPLAQLVEGVAPQPLGESQIRLENGVIRQTLALPTPTPHEIAPRIWLQLYPTSGHVLRVRAEHAGQVLGESAVRLAGLDQAFHKVELPWFEVPAGATDVTLVLEGHGVIVLATAVDRVAGGDLELNGVSRAPSDLAIQLVSGDRGIDRYLPLSRIAAGKPGILGWPRFSLLLIFAYVICMITLVGVGSRLLRYVERTA